MIYILTALLMIPENAWAFIPHSYPEFYIHQMGHIFFIISCIFIMWTIVHNGLHKEKGWRYIIWTEVFFILWNVDTFVGHITEFWIEPSQIFGKREGWEYFNRLISVEGREYLYYITKFDNLLLVPAMLLFYYGLKEHLGEEEKVPVRAAAVLPLLPVMVTDIAGAFIIMALAFVSFNTAFRLYRRNRENTLWNYMMWLSTSYVVFSLSRSTGHILSRIYTAAGYQEVWKYLEPLSGSFNTFTFIVIGTINMFFFKAYQSYLRITEDNRKIDTINRELTKMNQELETLVAERTMSLMALTVADRVRNPAAIIGLTCRRMLDKGDVSDTLGEHLRNVIEESEKLETIVRDFEAILKSRQSVFTYEDVNEIVRAAEAFIAKEAAHKGVSLTFRLADCPLKINAQKNLLRSAILHVIRNAVEATARGGSVTVGTYCDAGKVGLIISDTGGGIPKENIEKIFDPFFSTKQYRFGMGLPLVKQIVSEHLGEIGVESETGKGTTFRMIFPARWASTT